MQQFHYLTKQRNFVIQVGQIISHSLEIERYTIEEVNNLNRVTIAEQIYSKIHYSYFEGIEKVGKSAFLVDLAIYIDDKLPRIYLKKQDYEKFGGKALKNISLKTLESYGLKVQGAEKIKNENFSAAKMTEEYTSNYQNSASVKNPVSPAPQDNYQALTSYLRSNAIDVSKAEFTAILRTMNDLKNTNNTKTYILKKHSSSLNVPQSRITKHLKEMNFVSERTQQNKNSYLQKEAIASKRLEYRLIRENDK